MHEVHVVSAKTGLKSMVFRLWSRKIRYLQDLCLELIEKIH